MALYSYQAITPDGAPQDGAMDASSEAQVIESLNGQGLIPLKVFIGGGSQAASTSKKTPKSSLFGAKKVSQPDIVAFTQQLSSMLRAGFLWIVRWVFSWKFWKIHRCKK